ncbi:MAG: hypothetical protein EOO02_06335 [Chitinophagaceae bacterium]|nr:MAG: hypothetical protein EOO02_06335 [Chitinophagaceae bacterium]
MLAKHEQKVCPRCGAEFICKSGDIIHCQCYEVHLNDDTRRFLEQTNFDCLCSNCLIAISKEVEISKQHQFPTQKEFLIEGLHYYKENGYFVFTPLYHMLRGHCCKNGCRHCVYGFRNSGVL